MFQAVCQNNHLICFSIFVCVKKIAFSNKQRERNDKCSSYQLARRVKHADCVKGFLILVHLESILKI